MTDKPKVKKKKKRAEHDFYPTPEWCTTRFVESFDISGTYFLEPCVGNGAIIKALSKHNKTMSWHANDIPEQQINFEKHLSEIDSISSVTWKSFLDLKRTDVINQPDMIITNPPFSIAFDIIKHAMKEFGTNHICMLLRLNFLGSAERSAFFRENMPDVYVLPNRPSFDGEGSDTIEYAWFVWTKKDNESYACPKGTLVLLADTDKAQRKREKPSKIA